MSFVSSVPVGVQPPASSTHTCVSKSVVCRNPCSIRMDAMQAPQSLQAPQAPQTAVSYGSGMKLIQKADEATIAKLDCQKWPKWGCDSSTFPWTYEDSEVCLFIKGDVIVTADKTGDKMRVQEGDIALFPAGLSCTWEVVVPVSKYYKFGISI